MSDFGKDHWSLLAFVECRCVDNKGVPDNDRMRTNLRRHPAYTGATADRFGVRTWKPEYGTRLRGFFLQGSVTDKTRQIKSHDDWDCADDLEAAGLVKIGGSGLHPIWKLTKAGIAMAARLRQHKAGGGQFYQFNLSIGARKFIHAKGFTSKKVSHMELRLDGSIVLVNKDGSEKPSIAFDKDWIERIVREKKWKEIK